MRIYSAEYNQILKVWVYMSDITRREDIIFRAYKDDLLSLIKEAEINVDFNINLEATAMLFTVGDFIMSAFDSTTADRQIFLEKVENYSSNDNFLSKELDERRNFYSRIIRGTLDVRAECLVLVDKTKVLDNHLLCCAVVFCDILINPLCFNDYEHAPLSNMDFMDELTFSQKISFSIIGLLSKYIAEMTEYCESFELLASPTEHSHSTAQTANKAAEQTQTVEQSSPPKEKNKRSIKEKFQNTVTAIGVYVFYAVSFVIAFLPIYAIGFHSFLPRLTAYIAMVAYPPASVIFWIWGLINTINTFQDGFSIFYYIVFAVFFIPYFLAVIARFFKKQNKY